MQHVIVGLDDRRWCNVIIFFRCLALDNVLFFNVYSICAPQNKIGYYNVCDSQIMFSHSLKCCCHCNVYSCSTSVIVVSTTDSSWHNLRVFVKKENERNWQSCCTTPPKRYNDKRKTVLLSKCFSWCFSSLKNTQVLLPHIKSQNQT